MADECSEGSRPQADELFQYLNRFVSGLTAVEAVKKIDLHGMSVDTSHQDVDLTQRACSNLSHSYIPSGPNFAGSSANDAANRRSI